MRVVIRDAEWIIKRVDIASNVPKDKPYLLTCTGVSNIVSGREARFIEGYEDGIEILLPEETKLVQDDSRQFVKSRLFIESLLRRTPATDAKIHIAQHAAMDVLDYQLTPAVQALRAPRARILIADAVGIGKTLEAGILVSELIERGRGRRILVLTVKAMLDQFQKEFWNRFSIPLTCLDSEAIARLRDRIPAGHNPFLYVDKSIISIDTLKQDAEYRDLLDQAYWDIILIDEAHNVADRGTRSKRSRLAKRLSTRSDSLIMLTATPHDGKPESFASLIDMLDPTVLPDKSRYSIDDFKDKGLVIRRFKADILNQTKSAFQMRDIDTMKVSASDREEIVFKTLSTLQFEKIDEKHKPGTELFKTTLTKALFSSPAACVAVIEHRMKKLEAASQKNSKNASEHDLTLLSNLKREVEGIGIKGFSKFNHLVACLQGKAGSNFAWSGTDPEDRLVIFTESRETLAFLAEHLPRALGLSKNAVVILKGDDSDKALTQNVEAFNQRESAVRLMLATDVASEGLNLHRFCHRLIHFDIPWSLMTFQQRNGRVDRYGQTKQPLIRYLQTVPQNPALKAFGDARILELLIEKDANAQKNIDDPREFFGSKEEQEALTAAKMQGEAPVDDFNFSDPFAGFSFEDPLAGNAPQAAAAEASAAQPDDDAQKISERRLIFPSDFDFLAAGLQYRKTLPEGRGRIGTQADIDPARRMVRLAPPEDLNVRLAFLPKEVRPENDLFKLTDDRARVQEAIRHAALNPESAWPSVQLLWELHPVVQWMEDWAIGAFGRHCAPVLSLPDRLETDEVWVLLQAGYPNVRGYTPVHDWIAVKVENGVPTVHPRKDLMTRIDFSRPLINGGEAIAIEALQSLLPACVEAAAKKIGERRIRFESFAKADLADHLRELDRLRAKQLSLFGDEAAPNPSKDVQLTRHQDRARDRQHDIEAAFKDAEAYVREVLELGSKPFIQVAAVFCGKLSAPTIRDQKHDARADMPTTLF